MNLNVYILEEVL